MTREQLNRAYELHNRIKHNLEVIANLRAAAESTVADYSNERVQSSQPTGSRMSTFVEMACDLERTVQQQQEQLAALKASINAEIDTLDDYDVKLVMKLRYLDFYSWSRIAAVLVVSERTVFNLHRRGLENLQSVAVDCS